MNWVLCYLLRRKDYDSHIFEDDPVQLVKIVQSDIDYATSEANRLEDPEEAKEYRLEADTLTADLDKIKEWLPTAEHGNVLDLELYEVTIIQIPSWFRDFYLDIVPEHDSW